MRRVIGIDIRRTFGEMVFSEDGKLRGAGRMGMTRTVLNIFGKSLEVPDEVAIEATGKTSKLETCTHTSLLSAGGRYGRCRLYRRRPVRYR